MRGHLADEAVPPRGVGRARAGQGGNDGEAGTASA